MSDFSFKDKVGQKDLAALAGESVLCREFKYCRGKEIFGEGEEAQYVYQITTGAVRTYKLLPDGRRQINSFYLPGDLFGLENGLSHRFTAEAIVETKVRIRMRRGLFGTMPNEVAAANLIALVSKNLQHAENHMLLLGRKTALERVAAFLLEMDERQAYPNVLMLPMNRRDVADYLGLTVETVSRAFANLKDQNVLRFEGTTQRQIALLDRRRLTEQTI